MIINRTLTNIISTGITKNYQLVENLSSSNHFLIRELASRVTATSLPLVHLFGAVFWFGLGAVTKCALFESPFTNEHCHGGYYWKLSYYHLTQSVMSVFHMVFPKEKSLTIPKNLIAFLPKKSIICKSCYLTRIGSNLVAYIKAQWIVHCLQKRNPDIKFVHARFNMDDQFQLFQQQEHVMPNIPEAIPKPPGAPLTERFQTYGKANDSKSFKSIEEIADFFQNNDGVVELLRSGIDSTRIDWSDQEFKAKVKEALKPASNITLSLPPKNCYSIALHVRTGGTFDPPRSNFKHPKKMPPMSFYKYALDQALQQYNKQQRVYIQIFTDSQTPITLKEEFISFIKENYPDIDCQINVCEDLKKQKESVLSDMFSMCKYDVLIRGESGLSALLGSISDYKLEIYPTQSVKSKDKTAITEVRKLERDLNNLDERTSIRIPIEFEHTKSTN